MTKRLGLVFFILALSAAPAIFAPGASAQEEDPAESRAESFQAAEGPNTENIPGGALMVAAYGACFVLVLGYVVSLGYRQAQTARELASLRAEVEAGRSGADPDEED